MAYSRTHPCGRSNFSQKASLLCYCHSRTTSPGFSPSLDFTMCDYSDFFYRATRKTYDFCATSTKISWNSDHSIRKWRDTRRRVEQRLGGIRVPHRRLPCGSYRTYLNSYSNCVMISISQMKQNISIMLRCT